MFQDSSKVTSQGLDEYHRNKRFRRTTYREDSGVDDGINEQINEMQPQVLGVNDSNEVNDEDYAPIYNEDDTGGLPSSNSEFVISEDNTRDVYELNNDNDINRIVIPTERSLGQYLNGGGPDMDSRNQLQDYDQNKGKTTSFALIH